MKSPVLFTCLIIVLSTLIQADAFSQYRALNQYNPVWTTQSQNSSESMPLGGGDIGCNVWVENDELFVYFSRSGNFDENNTLLKNGRLRINLYPNPFKNAELRQELILKDGYISIKTDKHQNNTTIKIWVDVFNPIIHINVISKKKISAEAVYENWRFENRQQQGKENNANSWKWAKHVPVITKRDHVYYDENRITFYHRNTDPTVFDATVHQQGLDSIKSELINPLENLTMGGVASGKNFVKGKMGEGMYVDTRFKSWSIVSKRPATEHSIQIYLHNDQALDIEAWKTKLEKLANTRHDTHSKTIAWWNGFWQRSFVYINKNDKNEQDEAWQAGRNYQLFRYMLGCNAYGEYPTKFNGGLFTADPVFTDSSIRGTPDHRNWGGGTFTAQNQRLVYWPMLKSGDEDMMKPQFDFYNRILQTAILRSKVYWGHEGANFNEQIENFGLPNPTEYGWKRPADFDPGLEYNAWLEYEWDTVLEFCFMILQTRSYAGADIQEYLPLIKKSLIFFDQHYQYLAKKRGNKALDGNGHLILFPGSGAETFKMAYNASSTIAALKTVTKKLLQLPAEYLNDGERKYFSGFLSRIPPIPFMSYDNKPTIAPAVVWSRINNTESSQLYPVFPWGVYGVGRGGLDTARNTFLCDTFALKFRSHIGWKQDNIFAARLGLTKEAKSLTLLKLKNSGRRFPAFWGPGFDWVPDHNWGGSGMIGLQEMLMQTVDEKIYLFPAWPEEWDVHFKLNGPQQTTVEAEIRDGKIISLVVFPKEREKDVVLPDHLHNQLSL